MKDTFFEMIKTLVAIFIVIGIAILFTGCAEKEVIIKHEYKSKKIFIMPELLEVKDKVQPPRISEELNQQDQELIKGFILDLYFQNRDYASNMTILKQIIDNFNSEIDKELKEKEVKKNE